MKEQQYRFSVAGHLFDVVLPETYNMKELLPSFLPFYLQQHKHDSQEENPILIVKVSSHPIEHDSLAKLLSQDFGAYGHECRFWESDTSYFMTIQYTKGGSIHQMRTSRTFEDSYVFIDYNDPLVNRAISFFIMFIYAQRAVFFGTFLLHASVVEKSGVGYAFLGKSGTGKSTHTALWLDNIEQVSLLNDDNPAVRICEKTDMVLISGTPWSGKTDCYKNKIVKLGSLIRLGQAPINRFEWLNEFHALLSILPGCSSFRWNKNHYMCLCDILEKIVKRVPVGFLECLPDKTAVELCYEQIKLKIENENM